jgi:hypothetical protein
VPICVVFPSNSSLFVRIKHFVIHLNFIIEYCLNPIEEALEQYHFIVAVFYKGITLIAKRRLELKSLKHAEIIPIALSKCSIFTIVK